MKLRTFISLSLALILALTSQAMAVARGTSAPTGQMVLCIGTGSVTVFTDADGAPTSAPHICPDCALNVLLIQTLPELAAPVQYGAFDQAAGEQTLILTMPRWRGPFTRAPPIVV